MYMLNTLYNASISNFLGDCLTLLLLILLIIYESFGINEKTKKARVFFIPYLLVLCVLVLFSFFKAYI